MGKLRKIGIVLNLLICAAFIIIYFVVRDQWSNIKIKNNGIVVLEYGETDVIESVYGDGKEEYSALELNPSMFIENNDEDILKSVTIEIMDVENRVEKGWYYLALGDHDAIAYFEDEEIHFTIRVKDTLKPCKNLNAITNAPIEVIVDADENDIYNQINNNRYFSDVSKEDFSIEIDSKNVDLNKIGNYEVDVKVTDSSMNTLSTTLPVTVKNEITDEVVMPERQLDETVEDYMDRIITTYDFNISILRELFEGRYITSLEDVVLDINKDGINENISVFEGGTMGNDNLNISYADETLNSIPFTRYAAYFIFEDNEDIYFIRLRKNFNTHNIDGYEILSFTDKEVIQTEFSYISEYAKREVIVDYYGSDYFDSYVKSLDIESLNTGVETLYGDIEKCNGRDCVIVLDGKEIEYNKHPFYPTTYYSTIGTRIVSDNRIFHDYLYYSLDTNITLQLVFDKDDNNVLVHTLSLDANGDFVARGHTIENYEFTKVYEVKYLYENTRVDDNNLN